MGRSRSGAFSHGDGEENSVGFSHRDRAQAYVYGLSGLGNMELLECHMHAYAAVRRREDGA